MDMKDKVVVVTGAGGGIGSEFVRAFGEAGAVVVGLTREDGDLRRVEDILDICSRIKNERGAVDILVNNAGVGVYKDLREVSVSEWNDSMAVNATAPFVLIKELMPRELVVNIGSGAGVMPFAGRVAYCASKFALRGMSLSLSEEYEGKKPVFCLVTLGSTMTDFGPLNVEEKRRLQSDGKKYLDAKWVADEVVRRIVEDEVEDEIVIYPDEYEKSSN